MEKSFRPNSKFEILTKEGWSDFDGFRSTFKKDVVKVTTETGKTIGCSLDHRIEVADNYFEVVSNLNTASLISGEQIVSIEKLPSQIVYDPINVIKTNSYISNEFVSHNCEFMGSSGTLIAGWKLKELVAGRIIEQKLGITQYEVPTDGRTYVIIADVSRGKGLDYSAFSVIDISEMPYNQVCVYRSNITTPLDYANVIYNMAKIYNNAYILVEINDIGEQVSTSILFDFEYENIIYTVSNGRGGKTVSSGFGQQSNQDRGIRTTKQVKNIGCSILKLLVEQNQLIINDFDTINELSTFSRKNASYEAETGCTDDLVMGLVLFSWLSDQGYFKELSDNYTLMQVRDRTDAEIMDDLVPFGFTSEYETLGMFERSTRAPVDGEWITMEVLKDLYDF